MCNRWGNGDGYVAMMDIWMADCKDSLCVNRFRPLNLVPSDNWALSSYPIDEMHLYFFLRYTRHPGDTLS